MLLAPTTAGASPEWAEGLSASGVSEGEYAAARADEVMQAFVGTYFDIGDQDNPVTQEVLDTLLLEASASLQQYLQFGETDPQIFQLRQLVATQPIQNRGRLTFDVVTATGTATYTLHYVTHHDKLLFTSVRVTE